MAFSFSPKIVTDGLVLYLDAANPRSYVSGSTTWNDLSRGGNIGTLSGVTYSNSNGGNFIWDDNLDSITINLPTPSLPNYTSATVCFWLKTTDTKYVVFGKGFGAPYLGAVFLGGTGNGSWYHSSVGTPISYRNGNLENGPVFDNTWNYYTFVNCNFNNAGWNTPTLTILNYVGWEFNPGQLATFQIYNRSLTTAEIQQNYNATKSRFL